jgi:outer membrane lipoprotein SlyB
MFCFKNFFRASYKEQRRFFVMFKGTSFWSGVLSGGISQIGDIRSYMKGEISTQDFGVHTTSNVTGAVGIMAGMEYGAVLGSAVLPRVGTIIGSLVGFIIGNRLGSYAGYQVGNMVFKKAPLLLTGNADINLRIEQKMNEPH